MNDCWRCIKQFWVCSQCHLPVWQPVLHHSQHQHHTINNPLHCCKGSHANFQNQKENGNHGSQINHDFSSTPAFPIHALERQIHFICSHPECSDSDMNNTYFLAASKYAHLLQAHAMKSITPSTKVSHLMPSAATLSKQEVPWPCIQTKLTVTRFKNRVIGHPIHSSCTFTSKFLNSLQDCQLKCQRKLAWSTLIAQASLTFTLGVIHLIHLCFTLITAS